MNTQIHLYLKQKFFILNYDKHLMVSGYVWICVINTPRYSSIVQSLLPWKDDPQSSP